MPDNVLFIYLWNSMTALQNIKAQQKYVVQKLEKFRNDVRNF